MRRDRCGGLDGRARLTRSQTKPSTTDKKALTKFGMGYLGAPVPAAVTANNGSKLFFDAALADFRVGDDSAGLPNEISYGRTRSPQSHSQPDRAPLPFPSHYWQQVDGGGGIELGSAD